MNKTIRLLSLVMATLMSLALLTSCDETGNEPNGGGDNNKVTGRTIGGKELVVIEGRISGKNNHWTADKVYALKGIVTVPAGETLTIDAGTTIIEEPTASGATGVLVITRGAKIMAEGTAQKPIVFTSSKAVDNNAGRPAPGDFGGVIILGKAKVNTPTDAQFIEGLNQGVEEYRYGGDNDEDNSGVLRYVRIEYAGFILGDSNEINGLTCGGVGRGTTIDHIQVSWGLDDSFEFFGGCVNATHLVSYACDDDNFDFDNGFTGSITYGVAIANPASTHSDSKGKSDSNGIELDNNAKAQDETFSLIPKTHPTLTNVSIIGASTRVANVHNNFQGDAYKYAARVRRGGQITLKDCILTGYPKGFVLDPDADKMEHSKIEGSSFHGFDAAFEIKNGSAKPTTGIIEVINKDSAATFGMKAPFGTPADFTGAQVGAFPASKGNWLQGWTAF